MCFEGSDTEMDSQTFGSDFRRCVQFGSRSAKELMRKDTDGDDNEISEYQLLMKSLACQLQTRHITVAAYTSLQGFSNAHSERASQTGNGQIISKRENLV